MPLREKSGPYKNLILLLFSLRARLHTRAPMHINSEEFLSYKAPLRLLEHFAKQPILSSIV